MLNVICSVGGRDGHPHLRLARTITTCIVFIITILCVIATTSYGQQTLSGVVRDAETNETLVNATVRLGDEATLTDAFGRFSFLGPGEEQKTLTVTYIGYRDYEQSIDLPQPADLAIFLEPAAILSEAVVVQATRATGKTPTTYTNISREKIEAQNFGQDVPFLLNWTPSVVTTSDAGTGIGYTGIRIRGSDPTRINVTINGIPYNDS